MKAGRMLTVSGGRWVSVATGALLVLTAPLWASEAAVAGNCVIDSAPTELIAPGEAIFGRVSGRALSSDREIVYRSPVLEHDSIQLRIERTDGRAGAEIWPCHYGENWRSARSLYPTAVNVMSIGRRTDIGDYRTTTFTGLQGRRLLVRINNIPGVRSRSFSYRLSLHPVETDDEIAQHQHVLEVDDQEADASDPDLTSDPGPDLAEVSDDATDQQERLRDDPAGITTREERERLRDDPTDVTARGERDRLRDTPDITTTEERAEAAADADVEPKIVSDPDGFLEAPSHVVVGSSFEVSWAEPLGGRDQVTIVAADAEDGERGSRAQRTRVRDDTSDRLTAPADPGKHQVRYLSREDGVIARVPVDVVDTEVTLGAPSEVVVGSSFEVSWGAPIHGRDQVTIVPIDAADGERGSSAQRTRVGDSTSGSLRAPANPGNFEIRYLLNQDRRLMGRAPIHVADTEVTVDAPAQVVAGERFEVTWSEPIHRRDQVTIVPIDAADDERGSRAQRTTVGEVTFDSLRAPDEAGDHEVRYLLNQDRRVMARTAVEVLPEGTELEPELTYEGAPDGKAEDPTGRLRAPRQVVVGTNVEIELGAIDDSSDFVVLVPEDADEDVGHYTRMRSGVGDNAVVERQAPGYPGTVEIRYYLAEDRSIAARLPVEVVDTELWVSAPAQVEAGADFEVRVSDIVDPSDHLVVVDADRDSDDTVRRYTRMRNRVGTGTRHMRTAPEAAGRYEVRYYLTADHRLMARAPFEVVPQGTEIAAGAAETPDPDMPPRPWSEAPGDRPETADDLAALEERIEALAERLDEASPDEREEIRSDLAGIGAPAMDVLGSLVETGRIGPGQVRDLMGPAPGYGALPGYGAPAREAVPMDMAREFPADDFQSRPETQPSGMMPDVQSPTQEAFRADTETAAAPDRAPEPRAEAPMQEAAEPRYHVVGVEAGDVLNVREAAGVSSAIVGMLAPDATGVERSGREDRAPDGGEWWEILDPALPGGRGWANARYLAPDETAAAPTAPAATDPAAAPRYRVVGVDPDDVLNVRESAGVSAMIVAMLPPNASDIELTGHEQHVGDSTWVEIQHPALPGASGWVNARFLAPQASPAAYSPSSPTITSKADEFVRAGGYAIQSPEGLETKLQDALRVDPQSVFAPGAELTPLSKAVLMVEAAEGILPHARFHLRYGMAMVEAPPAANPIPMSFVEVHRFNLGPQLRAQLAATHGEDNVAPPEHFGVGPHVSYRFAMRPIMGHTADVVAASRAELPEPSEPCLGFHCLIAQAIGDHVTEWSDMDVLTMPAYQVSYQTVRNGALTPAAALDALALEMGQAYLSEGRLVWTGFEPRESVAPGEPFAEAVIELNLGQDQSVDAFMRDGEVMDHAIAAVWQRVASVAQGSGEPLILGAQAVEHRPGHE